jgi:hypothetical protein
MVYGRLKLGNVYGTELLPLWVPVTAQYVSTFGGFTGANPTLTTPIFVTNTLDNATTFAPRTNMTIGEYSGGLSAANLTVANLGTSLYTFSSSGAPTTSSTLYYGQAYVQVAHPTGSPTPTGAAYLALTLGTSNANKNCLVPAPTLATSGASMAYLQWPWCTNELDPNVQITFGTAKNRFIYLRENY